MQCPVQITIKILFIGVIALLKKMYWKIRKSASKGQKGDSGLRNPNYQRRLEKSNLFSLEARLNIYTNFKEHSQTVFKYEYTLYINLQQMQKLDTMSFFLVKLEESFKKKIALVLMIKRFLPQWQ